MHVVEAQAEVREVFRGGFYGQLVSGVLWLIAAAVGTWGSPRSAGILLFVGGMAIFPLTVLLLRVEGGRAWLSPGNPLAGLARQVAFTVPLGFPLAGAAALHRPHWFFPAAMLVVGAHYLPFEFLYGMRMFALLAALLAGGGLALAFWGPPVFALGGWATGGVLVAFAFAGRAAARSSAHRAEERRAEGGTLEELLAVEKAVMAAIRAKDRGAVEALVADSFVLRSPGSGELSRAAFLEGVAATPGTIESVDGEDVKVSRFGDLAVVTGTQVARVRLPDRDEPVTGRGVFTDVFRRENGTWKLVLAHTVELP